GSGAAACADSARPCRRCTEDPLNDSKNRAAQCEDSSVQQEGRAEVSRWSKYLDQDREDQEEEEEEAATERQQLCSRRKNSVGEKRKHQKSFLSSDVKEYAEEGVFQLVSQAKKHKKCFVAVPDGDGGDAVSAGSVVPAVPESVVPESTQPTTASTKPSKWEKFLSSSENSSENAAGVALSLQDAGGVRLDSTPAASAGRAGRCSERAGRNLPQDTSFGFRKCVASIEGFASKLPGTVVPSSSCSVEDMLFKEPQSQLGRSLMMISEKIRHLWNCF
ncbi:hypothetical protein N310_09863, partial [Acanthisitta chloris]